MHSSCSTVNHPYLKQWAKECSHQSRDDIMSYITRFLLPVSYPRRSPTDQSEEESGMNDSEDKKDSKTTEVEDEARSCADRGNMVAPAAFSSQNGTDRHTKDSNTVSQHVDISSLHLDPLPTSPPPPPQLPPPPSYNIADPPDPKSLQLAPLPPMASEDYPAAGLPPSDKDKVDGGSSLSSHHPSTASLEVFNDEFGVQEMSVFATSSGQQPSTAGSSTMPTETSSKKLISSSRSAFRPVVATPREMAAVSVSNSATLVRENTTTIGAESAKATYSKPKVKSEGVGVQTLSCLPSLSASKSGMETVTLGEFSEAFVKGDTTNWFQRMMLLDHIEAIQDKIRTWMEMIDGQLDCKSLPALLLSMHMSSNT